MRIDPKEVGLDVRSYSGNEAICICPFHEDHHPSGSFNMDTGLFFCFSCGAASNAWKLATKLGGSVNRKWIKTTSGKASEEWRKFALFPLARDNNYLKSRGVTDEQVEKFGIKAGPFGIVFEVRSKANHLVGVIIRRYDNSPRYLFFGDKLPVWPAERLVTTSFFEKIFLTEGVFGVLAADRAGVTAFSTLGAMVKRDISFYLQSFKVQVIFDADFAGYVGGARTLTFLPRSKVIIPGQEADELPISAWHAILEGVLTTRSIVELAKLSKDPTKFYKYLP